MHWIIGLLIAVAAGGHPADIQDRDQVLQAVAVMFEGLAARDTAKMSSVLEPDARLIQTLTQEGQPAMRVVPMTAFLASIASDGPEIEERYWDPQVRIQDNLATVWISYTFYVDGAISHCGEDNFQLARTTSGWKIIALADTQRRQGCTDPP